MPAVAVVVPCFNLGQYLAEAIDSVRAQTFQDVEIVVVDDGSTDPDTRRTIDALRLPNGRVIRSDNRGLSAARNLGIAQASAPYICCLDADDRLAPTWLAEAVPLLDADPDLAFVSHWLRTFGDESWSWQPTRCDLSALLDMNTVNGAALVRRSVVLALGGFDESMRDGCEDWEFWVRATAAGCRGTIVPRFLYEYRRRHGSMSRQMEQSGKRFELFTAIVARHEAVYREHLLELLLTRERTLAGLCAGIDGMSQELHEALEPTLAMRLDEVARARVRLDDLTRQREAHEAVLRRVRDLESSMSWQLTAPLRRAYEWLGLANRRRDLDHES